MSDLKPCPFCGETESLYKEHMEGTVQRPAYKIRCDNCGGQTEFTDRNCVEDWNTRPAPVPRVKPLIWSRWGEQGFSEVHKGCRGDAVYKVVVHPDDSGHILRMNPIGNPKRIKPFSTQPAGLEWFKQAAQKDYERRILSALDMEKDDG